MAAQPEPVAPSKAPGATLEVVEPNGTRRTVPVDQSPFLIGRGQEGSNHLQLSDPRISRQCASLTFEEGVHRLRDRGTRAGIFINGQKVESQTLTDGDTVSFGLADSVQLIFHAAKAEESIPELLSLFEQAGHMEEGTRELRHMNLLLEATTLLQSHLPVQEVLGAMLDRAIKLSGADRGLLLEIDSENKLNPLLARGRDGKKVSTENWTPSKTALAEVIKYKRSVMQEDLELGGHALKAAESIVAQKLKSVIALPLISKQMLVSADSTMLGPSGNLLGVLYLDAGRPLAFSGLERRILDTLGLESASILEKARLVKKERERMRMEQEMAAARSIQESLLPKRFPPYPHFQLTAVNRPCLEVGGDYYDMIEMTPDRTAFLVADVCGKGLGAAMMTAILQGGFSAMSLGNEFASVCAHVNKFISDRSEITRYATLFFCTLDKSGQLDFINAGHPPPLLVRGGKAEYKFEAENVPVGIFPDTQFLVRSHKLEPGDTLVLYTDGITEARSQKGGFFENDRLKEVVEANANREIADLQAAIMVSVEDFTKGAAQADDLTLMILRYGTLRRKPGDTI